MSKPPAGSRSPGFFAAALLVLSCAVVAAAAWWVSSSPALAPAPSLNAPTAPTHAQFFAYAQIAKPAPTSLPTLAAPSPTLVSTGQAIETHVEIVAGTPGPEYAAAEQSDPPAAANAGDRYILIDISEQHMYVYESGALIFSFVASTGMNNATRVGTFSVLDKIPDAYGATWDIWMPNWLGIYWAGSLQNGIHALPILSNGAQLWAGYLGTPISFGCIVIGTEESQLLYDWAEVGTPVEIQW